VTGKLYIVATPIGNLKDITLRALETLKDVDEIACEDTRHSRKLFNKFGIKKPLISLHEHNENRKTDAILKKIKSGSNIALISDAGTPLVSDPGYLLINKLLEEGVAVEAIPGPCAAINALVISGLPSDRFYFLGFLPPKSSSRIRKFNELKDHPSTLIFYESTHRIQKFLREAFEVLGSRPVVLVREMTKVFEEVLRGQLGELGTTLSPRSWKGEFVVLIAGSKHVTN